MGGADIGTARLTGGGVAFALVLACGLALLCGFCEFAAARPAQLGAAASPTTTVGSGRLQGVVSDTADGLPLAQVSVCAEEPGGPYHCTDTAPGGEYLLSQLPAGKYEVEFEPHSGNFVAQYYEERDSSAEAVLVSVTEGATTSGIDAALKVGGIIKGKVTAAAGGVGVADTRICATPVALPGELFGACATSSASGEYTLERLESGPYKVRFTPPDPYLSQYYKDEPTEALATAVDVTGGQIESGVDAALEEGGRIEGTVSFPGEEPPGGIQVCAIEIAPERDGEQCAKTEQGGRYTISTLASGEYEVDFHGSGNLVGQEYRGGARAGDTETVLVAAGSSTTGIDATLQDGGRIEGLVTVAGGGAPVEPVEVCAQSPQLRACASTDAAGQYEIEGLVAASYTVSFNPRGENLLTQYYGAGEPEGEAAKVPVAVGVTVTGINAVLRAGGEITGTVFDRGTGLAVERAEVCAQGSQSTFFEHCAESGPGGRYTIQELATGVYKVRFSAATLVTQYYDDGDTINEAEPVTVLAGQTTPEIDATLDPGATITGHVTSAHTGEPLYGIRVCTNPLSAVESAPCAETGTTGDYTITGLAAGEYRVSFSGTEYPYQYYPGTFSFTEAKSVDVTAGETTGPIDAALGRAGEVAGTVTSATTHLALEGVPVCILYYGPSACGKTGAGGRYTISDLAPGPYTVVFESSGDYLEARDDVTVSSEASSEANAALSIGARITGRVSEAGSGQPISEAQVCYYSAREYVNLFGTCVKTGAEGVYAIEGLAGGEWILRFSAPNFAPQFFDGALSVEEASPVVVTTGVTTDDVNASLSAGGQISGVVRGPSGSPLEGAEVCANPSAEEPYQSLCGTTDATGAYTVAGLATGAYTVRVSDFGQGYDAQYYDGSYWSVSATPVSVTAGESTDGIDARLGAGGVITGTARAAATGDTLAGIEVCARVIPPEGEFGGFSSSCKLTGTSGEYSIPNLTPGEYEVGFSAPAQTFVRVAEAATVVSEQTDKDVDAALVAAGKISGVVTGGSGGGLAGVEVCASATVSERPLGGCAETNRMGDYTIAGLEAASYSVMFSTYQENYVTQYYDDASTESNGRLVPVSTGGAVTGIDAQLQTGGQITGKVTSSAGGAPVEDAWVCALAEVEGKTRSVGCVSTSITGEYTLDGLPTGSYRVHFGPGRGAAPEYYGGTDVEGEATPVAVTAGSISAGINGSLSPGGELGGRVTAASGGKRLRGVSVCARLLGAGSVEEELGEGGCGQTSDNGEYTIEDLDPGVYVVEFSDTGKYATQFYEGVVSATEAAPVTVAVGAITEGIDAAMTAVVKGSGSKVEQGGGSTGNAHSAGSGPAALTVRFSPKLTGTIAVRPGLLSVPLSCGATSGDCMAVSVTVSVVETVVGGRVTAVSAARGRHVRRIKRTLVIGSAKVTLAAGRSVDLLVHLNAAGRRLIAQRGQLAALVAVRTHSRVLDQRVVHLHGIR